MPRPAIPVTAAYFNPRSREGSDHSCSHSYYRCRISIHAPARGATEIGRPDKTDVQEFQSTLPRGERLCRIDIEVGLAGDFNPRSREGSDRWELLWRLDYTDFNPRSREGSDPGADILIQGCTISIHAPARGATFRPWETRRILWHFNPRSREGSDCRSSFESVWTVANFNPRSREGSDAAHPPHRAASTDFNPRSREGSDPGLAPVEIVFTISIHAPARGATGFIARFYRPKSISIHAPARGATTSSQRP